MANEIDKQLEEAAKTLKPAFKQVIDTLAEYNHVMQGGLGVYDTFVHYDIRGTEARWNNKTK